MYKIIKELCDSKGISPSALALKLGFSKNIFGQLKSGRTKTLSFDKATKVADYFGVPIEYLFSSSETEDLRKHSGDDLFFFFFFFEDLCEKNNTTPAKVAKDLGLSNATTTKWKRGAIPQGKTLAKVADYFDVSTDYLLGKTSDPTPEKEKSHQPDDRKVEYDSVSVILFDVIGKVRAGYGGMAQEEYTDETCPIPTEYIKGHEKEEFFVLRISGNSMYPKLLDGDKVLVERCTSVDSGSIAIVLYDSEEATVKTVRYAPGEDWVELIPANPEYQTKRIEGPDLMKVQILGRVRKLIRDI